MLRFIVICIGIFGALGTLLAQSESELCWSKLPDLPNRLGVAGPFAGTHNGVLIVAGGANFPDSPPWEGGTKVWYDSVFVLERPESNWKEVGRLPRPLGYGVSLSTDRGIVCIGGSDFMHHHADCFLLRWESGELKTQWLPSLPKPCANFSGAMIGSTIYIAGGIETPTATSAMKTFWSLDVNDRQATWKELEPWPGPARMLAVTAVLDNSFYLASGTDLTSDEQGKPVRKYLRDVYCYRPMHGWKPLADMPRPAVAAPTPAPVLAESSFLILSGDDGSLVHFQPMSAHPGFPKSILAYEMASDCWKELGEVQAGHVTTSIVRWNGGFVIPSGEVRPGVRSPVVWSLKTN